MSNTFKRSDRVAGEIQRKLAEIIRMGIKDPRLSHFVTITGVDVSGDLSYAKVYFTVLNEDPAQSAVILNSAARFMRTALARTLKLRTVPELRFIYDESIEYGRKLSQLINKVASDNEDKPE